MGGTLRSEFAGACDFGVGVVVGIDEVAAEDVHFELIFGIERGISVEHFVRSIEIEHHVHIGGDSEAQEHVLDGQNRRFILL